MLYANDVAPFTGTFTFALHPVTRPATSGAAGLLIYTIGAAVAGFTVVFTNVAADSMNVGVNSTPFALPANGYYVIGVTTSAAMATAALAHISALLQANNSA